jgi:hypothetical protein
MEEDLIEWAKLTENIMHMWVNGIFIILNTPHQVKKKKYMKHGPILYTTSKALLYQDAPSTQPFFTTTRRTT